MSMQKMEYDNLFQAYKNLLLQKYYLNLHPKISWLLFEG